MDLLEALNNNYFIVMKCLNMFVLKKIKIYNIYMQDLF